MNDLTLTQSPQQHFVITEIIMGFLFSTVRNLKVTTPGPVWCGRGPQRAFLTRPRSGLLRACGSLLYCSDSPGVPTRWR